MNGLGRPRRAMRRFYGIMSYFGVKYRRLMQHEDDLRGLEKVVQFIRAVSVLFLLLNSYWFCYGWFAAHDMTHAVLDWILLSFQRTTHLFSYSVTSKFCCFILLVLGCLGTPQRPR